MPMPSLFPSEPPSDGLPRLSDAIAAAIFKESLRPGRPSGPGPGDHIQSYLLVEPLGDGGFGTVWLAEQEEPVRRTVALKILKPGMDSLEVLARFEQERRILALMDHPNIARVLDAGSTPEGRPFFVMELVPGMPLTQYCLDRNLPLEERLRLFQSVCTGVQHAHHKGIIHRDLKPSNLLVTEIDGAAVPKIIDFGIAKAAKADRLSENACFTRGEQILGTPVYMSPEQADANPDIDTRSDVYSLGAVLYELLADRPPFDVKTLHGAGLEEMRRILRDVTPIPPTGRKSETGGRRSRDLDQITLQALAKDRERRYQSATALRDDVGRFLSHEPITARATSRIYLLRRWVRRHWLATTSMAGALALITLGTVSTYWQKHRAEAALQIMAITLSEGDAIGYTRLNGMRDTLRIVAERSGDLTEQDQLRLAGGLAVWYLQLRDWDKAVLFSEKTMALVEKLNSPAKIKRRFQEGHLLCLLGAQRSDEALALVEKMLPDYEENLLPDDPGMIFLLTIHAKALRSSGKPKEAVAAFEALFERIKNWPSDPSPTDVVSARLSYPLALRQAGEKERALHEACENIRLSSKLLGLVSPQTVRAYVQAANECEFAGLNEEAIDHFTIAWKLFIDHFGPNDLATIETKNHLIRLYDKLGFEEEALDLLRYTVTSFKANNGLADPSTLGALEALINALIEAGKAPAAKLLAQDTHRQLEALDGPERPLRKEWLPRFAGLMRRAGDAK